MSAGLILGEVGQGIRRNLSMVVAVVLVTFISLTFFGAAILLQLQINQMKSYWYDRAEVAVYLCTELSPVAQCDLTEVSQEQIDSVRAVLEGPVLSPYIQRIDFETREEAYEKFIEQWEGTSLADIADPTQFGSTFYVNMIDPEQSEIVADQLSSQPGVESIRDQRAVLEPIFAIMNAASITAIGIAALMLVSAVLLIATTIRLSAFSRRRELGIMRLVGASNRFIETPFVLEGMFAALVGAVLASGAIAAIVHFFVQGYLAQSFIETSFVGMREALLVAPVLLVVAGLLAALSASAAIRRYLKI